MQKYHADIFSLPLFLPSSLGLMPGDGISSMAEAVVKSLGTSQAAEPVVFLQVVLHTTAVLQAGPDHKGKIQHKGTRAWGLLHVRLWLLYLDWGEPGLRALGNGQVPKTWLNFVKVMQSWSHMQWSWLWLWLVAGEKTVRGGEKDFGSSWLLCILTCSKVVGFFLPILFEFFLGILWNVKGNVHSKLTLGMNLWCWHN